MKRYICLIVVFLICGFYSVAQTDTRCGADKILEKALQDPEKKQILDQLEIFTKEFVSNMDNYRSKEQEIIIPVVVHVIHNYGSENISYEQIDNGIARINEDFNGLNDDLSNVMDTFVSRIGSPGMHFRLATKDPDGNCTYGVTRTATEWTDESGPKVMSLVNWPSDQYVNIYVVRTFEQPSSAAAYATYPGMGSQEYGDYIFCRYNYFGDWNVNSDTGPTDNNWARHTLPHEMGHFFNLAHPWGSTNEPGVALNCDFDDNVEDTPNTIGVGDASCNLGTITCPDSDPLTLDIDNVENIMDYSNCAYMFTQGQSDRVIAAANNDAGGRSSLWQPSNLIATGTDSLTFFDKDLYAQCAPTPDIAGEAVLGCTGKQIMFENYTYNYRYVDVEYTWTFQGDLSETDTDGDGIFNNEDDDIDGDGVLNDEDDDIDGDGEYDEDGNCESNCNEDDDEYPNGEITAHVELIDNGDAGVTYLEPGTYDVTLKACRAGTDVCGSLVLENHITIVSPSTPDKLHTDIDGDGWSNDEDDDIDGDGEYLELSEIDTDGDEIFNDEDDDIDGDGMPNDEDDDIDGDGEYDEDDNCESNCNEDDQYPYGGGCASNCNDDDDDIDGDGEAMALSEIDTDGDGIFNDEDDDIDGDGEAMALSEIDTDDDGIFNDEDDDIDGDGEYLELSEVDTDDDGIFNWEDNDIDEDGLLNEEDDDIDGDGIANEEDQYPNGNPGCQSNCNDDDDDIDGDGEYDDDGNCESNCNDDDPYPHGSACESSCNDNDSSPRGTVLLFSQSFESADFPEVSEDEVWWLRETDDQNWERTQDASSHGNSSLKIKSQQHGTRTTHTFSTPDINLAGFINSNSDPVEICFDYAYARRLPYTAVDLNWGEDGFNPNNHVYPSIHHDDLVISFASCNDVTDWTERPRLSTRPGFSGYQPAFQDTLFTTNKIYFNAFIPQSDEWKQKCISLQPVFVNNPDSSAILKLEFVSSGYETPNSDFALEENEYIIYANGDLQVIEASTIGGNWLYIDNIKVGNRTFINNEYIETRNDAVVSQQQTIVSQKNLDNLKISPNPCTIDEGWISFSTDEKSDITISMSNLLGVSVGKRAMNLVQGLHDFKISDLFSVPSKGPYILIVEGPKFRNSKIVIIH